MNMEMKKVLIITYHFPPDSEVGGLRVQKYAKYLPLFGWKPIVLTVNEKYYPKKDYERLGDISCEIFRTVKVPGLRDIYLSLKKLAGKFLLRRSRPVPSCRAESIPSIEESNMKGIRKMILSFMWLPDDKTGWIVPAFFTAVKLVRRREIDTVITTSPPHSVQITGMLLKFLLRKRWIVDFRDAWSLTVENTPFSGVEKRLEKITVEKADIVITATEHVRDYLLKTYPHLDRNKFKCIPNGFDLEDFQNARPERNGTFSITYLGDFYIGRSPEIYLKAVSALIKEKRIDPEKVRLKFAGINIRYVGARPLAELLSEFGLEKQAVIMDAVSYSAGIRLIKSSDVLVVLSPQSFVQPTKVFEYMAGGGRVIAFTPPGSLADLVAGYPKGYVVDLDDLQGAKRAVMECYEASCNGSEESREFALPDRLMFYERKNLTRRLTEYL